ncbi:MAG: c-type cytochrome [Nitrosomonas sp.]|nr:c-type cytochrome [Nitrosomonas sp.]MDP1950291.1 c-type cytochrome [Nitrosomonas sp.]
MNKITNMVAVIVLILSAPVLAEKTATKGDAVKGEEIAAGVCAGCHNADGNSVIPVNPSLAGQHAEYITKQLIEFKMEGDTPAVRNSPIMSAMVTALSVEDMRDLAAFYAQQKPTSGIGTETNEEVLRQGEIIYRGGNIENGVPACASCHLPDGSGIPPHYPQLAGQHAAYTLAQLNAFNDGIRDNDKGIMLKVISRMSAQEKRAVSEFISSLK